MKALARRVAREWGTFVLWVVIPALVVFLAIDYLTQSGDHKPTEFFCADCTPDVGRLR